VLFPSLKKKPSKKKTKDIVPLTATSSSTQASAGSTPSDTQATNGPAPSDQQNQSSSELNTNQSCSSNGSTDSDHSSDELSEKHKRKRSREDEYDFKSYITNFSMDDEDDSDGGYYENDLFANFPRVCQFIKELEK